jgi:hypothetical protein
MQGRAYRIRELFSYLEFNMSVSLLAVTLARNFGVSGWRATSACGVRLNLEAVGGCCTTMKPRPCAGAL